MNIAKAAASTQYKIPFGSSPEQARLPKEAESADFYSKGSWQVERDGKYIDVGKKHEWMAGLKGEGARARFIGNLPDPSRPLSESHKKSNRTRVQWKEGAKAALNIAMFVGMAAAASTIAVALGPLVGTFGVVAAGTGAILGSRQMIREAKQSVKDASSVQFESQAVPVDGRLRRVEDSMIFQADQGSSLIVLPVSDLELRSANPRPDDS